MKYRWLALPSILFLVMAVLGAVAPSASADTTCNASNAKTTFHGQDSQGDGYYYADADIWNPEKISQTMWYCSHNSWAVSDTAPQPSDGAVQAYPNVHHDFVTNWNNVVGSSPLLSSFKYIHTSFASTADEPSQGSYDAAYDIWFNGFDNGSLELMVWNQFHNQTPAGSIIHKGVTDPGLTGTFNEWTDHQGYVAFVPDSPLASGTLHVGSLANTLESQGLMPKTSRISQLDYGVEVVGTGNQPQQFEVSNFTVSTAKK